MNPIVLLLATIIVATNAHTNNNNLRRELGFESCLTKCAWNLFKEDCITCLRDTEAFVLGDAQLPAGAIGDLLQAKLGKGYTEMWCGKEDLPMGWKENQDGKWTGCEKTENFPGNGATSHQSHEYVKTEMQKYPREQFEGKIWRGNELGFIISNEKFTSEEIKPRAILLGSTKKQHMLLRPVLDRFFSTCNSTCQTIIREEVDTVLGRDSIKVQHDLKVMVHKILMRTIFGSDFRSLPWAVDDFIDTQSSYTTLSTLTQMVTDGVGGAIETLTKTRSKLSTYYKALKVLVEEHEDRFVDIDFETADCGETLNNGKRYRNCVSQVASAMLDTLLAAGGLSVPGALSTGLFVLYGDLESANQNQKFRGIFPAEARNSLVRGKEIEFFYESMRFFAPVVGFPKWTTPPARATDDSASQVKGGKRVILNLALANKDPNVWGSDAHQFKVRSIEDYHKHFLGFADFAEDGSKEAGYGKMNRKCPGKELAIQIGKVFFQSFDQDAWHTKDTSEYQEATPFMDEFVLYDAKTYPCPYTCGSIFLDPVCHAKTLHCKQCLSCSSRVSCSQRCNENCNYGCSWWNAGCHWRQSLCKGRQIKCYTQCTAEFLKCEALSC